MGTCEVEVKSSATGKSAIIVVKTVPTLESTARFCFGPGYLEDDDGPIFDPNYKLVDGMKLLWRPSSGSTEHRTTTAYNVQEQQSNNSSCSVLGERPVQKLKSA